MIKFEILRKKLGHVGGVHVNAHSSLGLVREGYSCRQVELKAFTCFSLFPPTNDDEILRYLNSSRNWVSHDGCRSLTLYNDRTISVRIWDGDNMTGHRTEPRWEGSFLLAPEEFEKIVKDNARGINQKFFHMAEDELNTRKENERKHQVWLIEQEWLGL